MSRASPRAPADRRGRGPEPSTAIVAALRVKGAAVGFAVDATGEARDHDHPRRGEVPAKARGRTPVRPGVAFREPTSGHGRPGDTGQRARAHRARPAGRGFRAGGPGIRGRPGPTRLTPLAAALRSSSSAGVARAPLEGRRRWPAAGGPRASRGWARDDPKGTAIAQRSRRPRGDPGQQSDRAADSTLSSTASSQSRGAIPDAKGGQLYGGPRACQGPTPAGLLAGVRGGNSALSSTWDGWPPIGVKGRPFSPCGRGGLNLFNRNEGGTHLAFERGSS